MKSIILLTLCTILLSACKDGDDESEIIPPPSPNPTERASRTVLIYCVGQNDLGISAWRNDSIEIANGAQYVSNDDRLLVYIDNAHLPRLYQFTANEQPQLVHLWDTDAYSTNPEQFKDVIEHIATYYPADEYGLVCWSHSDGWLPSSNTNYTMSPMSFGIDVGPDGNMHYNLNASGQLGTQMNIPEMASAIESAGIHFRYIFFDSCLMQCIESCYDLRHATDFVVASPMPIPFEGAYYTNMIKKGLFSDSIENIVNTYFEDVTTMTDIYYDFGLVISSVKTEHLEAVANVVKEALKDIDWGSNFPNMEKVDCYYRYIYRYYYRPHYYDLRASIKHLCSEANFQAVSEAISKAVTSYKATSRFWIGPDQSHYATIDTTLCCGISMFVPQAAYTRNASSCIYGDHNENFKRTEWAQAIGKD